jgi:predicted nucleotidyltransferase
MSGEPISANERRDAELPFRPADCPALAAAWNRSRETLAELRRRLASVADVPGLETVAVAGSLGRREQTVGSDVDLIVVVSDGDGERVWRSVWDSLESAAFPRPNASGIFARSISAAALRDPDTLGVIDEEIAVFGLRMQLLLEARPVCRDDRFAVLMRRVLLRFCIDDEDPWRPLVDDLLRYHRSLCARYRAAPKIEPTRWQELRLKAGFGRLINVVGLLVLLGDSLAESDPPAAVLRGCDGTPLRRIAASYRRHGDAGFDRICELYEPFVAAFGDVAFRERLNSAAKCDTITTSTLQRLDRNAVELKRELSRFLLERIHVRDWPPQFCDDLLL